MMNADFMHSDRPMVDKPTKPTTTCGPLFKRCLELFTSTTTIPVELFAAGFLCGQAEKVYLGSCKAAMVRPSKERRLGMLGVACYLSTIYGLQVSVFENPEIADEIWIHKPEDRDIVGVLSQLGSNSPEWHKHRAMLCGIPESDVDIEFHNRPGYRERCD